MSQATSDRAAGARHDGRRQGKRGGAEPGGPVDPSAAVASPESGRTGGRRRGAEPLAAVLALGDRASRVGAFLGVTLAVTSHGAASARAIVSGSLRDMRHVVAEMRLGIHDYLWAIYEVDVPPPPKAEEPKPPEPEPPPAPEPAPVPKVAPPPQANTPPPKDDPYDPPPAAAAAAKVLTKEPDPEEVLDMTDRGIASGEGQGVGYGQVAGAGTAKTPTFNPNAKVGGVVGGKGTGDPAPPPPPAGPDLSAPPGLIGSSNWNCPFPPEADVDQIDQAKVVLMVMVRPDGSPLSVKVVSDPGHGFGRSARMCALGMRYRPGKDRSGASIAATTPPITVNFTR
ncbi:energy transducer TonB [Sorangium sp. So ce1000]|uniref:energy transducer TonB n=1 Tax=Sorangium sp. So ce1000 TaxID=3133325 RepID=UPI003F61FA54